jgi:hypothetical protein
MNTLFRIVVIGLCFLSRAFAAVDTQTEQDIQAILKFIPASERENVAAYLRKPGPPASVPNLVAGNTLNGLKGADETKVALPLARRLVSFLEDTKGSERTYAFNRVVRLADKNPEVAVLAKEAMQNKLNKARLV